MRICLCLLIIIILLLIFLIGRCKSKFVDEPIDRKCVVCLTARKTSNYVKDNFKNFKDLQKVFDTIVVSYYLESDDVSTINAIRKERKNFDGEVNIIINKDPPLKNRTDRIAKGRNANVDYIRNNHRDAEYFIVMDGDNVCPNSKFNYNVLRKYLNRNDWDALSFNSSRYYDAWALRYEPCIMDHRFQPIRVLSDIRKKLKKLKDGELLEVYSAFNGFAIYKTDKFIDFKYGGKRLNHFTENEIKERLNHIKKQRKLLVVYISDRNKTDDECEHVNFHLDAIKRNNARIRIAKDKIF